MQTLPTAPRLPAGRRQFATSAPGLFVFTETAKGPMSLKDLIGSSWFVKQRVDVAQKQIGFCFDQCNTQSLSARCGLMFIGCSFMRIGGGGTVGRGGWGRGGSIGRSTLSYKLLKATP